MFVLDTNTLIYYFKGLGNVAAHLLRLPPKEIAIPSIVIFELETGLAKSNDPQKRRIQLTEVVSFISILPFALPEARRAAQIRAGLEKSGTPIGPYDLLIAATAAENQATLVTHNLKEFGRISGMKVVDWF